jgi:hypothetical protein
MYIFPSQWQPSHFPSLNHPTYSFPDFHMIVPCPVIISLSQSPSYLGSFAETMADPMTFARVSQGDLDFTNWCTRVEEVRDYPQLSLLPPHPALLRVLPASQLLPSAPEFTGNNTLPTSSNANTFLSPRREQPDETRGHSITDGIESLDEYSDIICVASTKRMNGVGVGLPTCGKCGTCRMSCQMFLIFQA